MHYCKLILIALFLSAPLASYSKDFKDDPDFVIQDQNPIKDEVTTTDEDTQTIELMINNESKVKLKKVPKKGKLEVYTILGVKKRTIDIKKIIGEYNIDLPKGIYIFKVAKVAQKVVVK